MMKNMFCTDALVACVDGAEKRGLSVIIDCVGVGLVILCKQSNQRLKALLKGGKNVKIY
jgi:hypothetical protein